MNLNDTIIAVATPKGEGAITLLRVSGPEAISKTDYIFETKSKQNLKRSLSPQVFFGTISSKGALLDEVLVTVFKGPRSYTGEDVIEISCHGSPYIQQQILQCFIQYGVRVAEPGEFTMRAYLNKKMDLSQAEAVADLIASDAAGAHKLALQQMRGGFSSHLENLRTELINFTAMIELELDFSEEDVSFADRKELIQLVDLLQKQINQLISSFSLGNAIKNGIPTAIAGKPNAGKSSLLNALLNEEKAIVSNIAGTTRDSIEDTLTIEGIKFRFIDTAGLRETQDEIEAIGVKKALEKVLQAQILLYLFDPLETSPSAILEDLKILVRDDLQLLIIENKIDRFTIDQSFEHDDYFKNNIPKEWNVIYFKLSTFQENSIKALQENLHQIVEKKQNSESILISNARHYEALLLAAEAMQTVHKGVNDKLSGDLLSIDLKEAIYHIGSISGAIEIDKDILGTIFGKFCIGK
tara:strand:- start:4579 stop:5982 length:1404 start_codon:yes stop_codon:yes gene_type:complete